MPSTEAPIAGAAEPVSGMAGAFKALRWSLPFLAALLPIMLLGIFSYKTASESVRSLVESQNETATLNVSQLLTQDFKRTTDIAGAIASVPGTLDAVRTKNDFAMQARLQAIVLAYPQIDRVFITDRSGTLWTDFPRVAGEFAKNQSATDWYRGISLRWKPYISNAYIRSHDPESPVVAIATPIFDETGRVMGALVFEYRAELIRRNLVSIRLGETGYAFVVDGAGNVVAHPRIGTGTIIRDEYSGVEEIKHSRSESMFFTSEYIDPLAKKRMAASFQPLTLGGNSWVVIAQQPAAEAFAPLNRVRANISIMSGVLSLITLGMVIALGYMERRNEKLNKQLGEKNQTLQDITSFVSHQLRAPVAAMRWTIEGIIDGDYGKVTPEIAEPLGSLKDVAIQNGKLIDDILNISRIDRGVIEVVTEAVPLKDIAERAMRDYHTAAEKAGLTLTLKDSPAITVQADKEKMAESVTNAISNAIKHTKKGGITLSCRSDGAFGYIDVTDTGEGMPPEILNNLFSRTGVKGSNTNSSQSTGMGLYIARNFMQLQGGDILVTSESGKGSTFSYKIPLSK